MQQNYKDEISKRVRGECNKVQRQQGGTPGEGISGLPQGCESAEEGQGAFWCDESGQRVGRPDTGEFSAREWPEDDCP